MYENGLPGKKRSFGRGLLLTIITIGIYPYYWHYKVVSELHNQRQKGEVPIVLFIICLVPFVSMIGMALYMSHLIDTLNAARHDAGLLPNRSLGSFLVWYVLGSFLIIGPFVAYHQLQGSINDVWDAVQSKRQAPQEPIGAPAPQ